MMAGNPSWWSMIMNGDNNMHQHISPSHHEFVYPSSISDNINNPSSLPPNPSHHQAYDQDFPLRSWSQLLMGGGEEQELRFDHANLLDQHQKKCGTWEGQQVLNLNNNSSFGTTTRQLVDEDIVKQEASQSNYDYGYVDDILNFSGANKTVAQRKRNRKQHQRDHSHELSDHKELVEHFWSVHAIGGVSKKARAQHDHELSSQPALKVRKEKVMDRITALHQLVSPFGKTDTASVLSEAIVCIRFLQAQIEDSQGLEVEDLLSRGLCLVPVSNCTQHVEYDTGSDYWGPTALGGGF